MKPGDEAEVVFAGYRFLFAGLLLLLFALAQRKPIARLSPRQFGQLTLLGLTQTTIQYSLSGVAGKGRGHMRCAVHELSAAASWRRY
jgi:drug/metabolite transporter (DMT)-like permease